MVSKKSKTKSKTKRKVGRKTKRNTKHNTKHHVKRRKSKKITDTVRKFARKAEKTGFKVIKSTGDLGIEFLKIGARVPKQMVHDSRLLGRKFRKKFK